MPIQTSIHPDLIPRNQTILVVEDEMDVLENIKELLEAEGFRTVPARNGEEAYRLILEARPDLIISDVRMPHLDGRGLLARLLQTSSIPNIPFILLTALTDREDQRAAMELGADDYITKPFTRKDLLGAVQRRLQKHKQIQTHAIQKSAGGQKNLSLSVPYEMLQPITKIIDLTSQLKQMRTDPVGEDVYQTAETIRVAAEGLMRFVSNYILLIEVDGSAGESGPRNAGEIAELDVRPAIVESVESIFWEYGRTADMNLQIQDSKVAVHEPVLIRIIEELLRNALSNTLPGQVLTISGLALADAGVYQLSVRVPKNTLFLEQMEWLEKNDPLPLTDYMKVGVGFILAHRLALASGSQLRITLQGDDQVSIELSMSSLLRTNSDEGMYV